MDLVGLVSRWLGIIVFTVVRINKINLGIQLDFVIANLVLVLVGNAQIFRNNNRIFFVTRNMCNL